MKAPGSWPVSSSEWHKRLPVNKVARAPVGWLPGFHGRASCGNRLGVSEVTLILERAQQGDPKAADELLPLVYAELRRLAAHKMASEAAAHTLQPTALVHEAWLRLVDAPEQHWNGRNHFFMAAAEAMRRILIERLR